MAPRSHWTSPRTWTTVVVVVGLIASIVAGVFLIPMPTEDLPGIALEAKAILVVERIAVLFGAWLLVQVVVARALLGDLPIEISGRGIRYADARTAQDGLVDSESALDRVDDQFRALRERVVMLEASRDDLAHQPRRYAMKDGGHDH
jgi:hypothetical protein